MSWPFLPPLQFCFPHSCYPAPARPHCIGWEPAAPPRSLLKVSCSCESPFISGLFLPPWLGLCALSLWEPARREVNPRMAEVSTCCVCAQEAQGGRALEARLPLRTSCLPAVLAPLQAGGGMPAASSRCPGLGCRAPAPLARIRPRVGTAGTVRGWTAHRGDRRGQP